MKNSNGSAIHSAIIVDGLSSDITKAYAWIRDQRDERDERLDEQGADRTAQCLRSADGVFRAPLAVLIERGESTEVAEESEELNSEDDDGIDNDVCFCPQEPDDEYSRMAEQLLGDLEDMPEPALDLDHEPVSRPVLVSNLESNNPATRHLTVGKTIIRVYNRYLKLDRTSWKANTSAEKQSLRHF